MDTSRVLYEHRQQANMLMLRVLIAAIMLLPVGIGIYAFLTNPPSQRAYAWLPIGMSLFVGALLWVILKTFSILTVRVTTQFIDCGFREQGFGFHRVPLAQIRSARIITPKWWWGTGYRLLLDGTMLNVARGDVVELELQYEKLRIGTDEPDVLLAAIERARGSR